ncbi:hypothetical protein A2Z33_01725 [Candidatus Gottesmanbacteria bacterium RBG_16_52_11]|uniref:Uncharacterized protein n=1 Tax=Candidatus Gottesmanbacteria bacterium RBG_16_52_11 TaxID=1798374 RepID=A0A1F5YPM7_9BACT|nr:MAG: hypothetical protein A2Z33_01725 [Candidatus Gottesmanbacteria bacterium RBG_16_52_11]
MTTKSVGWILVGIGVLTMVFAAVNVVLVFAHRADPVGFFSFSGIGIDTGQLMPVPALGQPETPGVNLEIVPPGMINQTANIFAHMLLMGFIVNIGYKLASLGTQLTRTIEVKLRGLPPDR